MGKQNKNGMSQEVEKKAETHNEEIRSLCDSPPPYKNRPYVTQENGEQWLIAPNKYLHRISISVENNGKVVMRVGYEIDGNKVCIIDNEEGLDHGKLRYLVCIFPNGREQIIKVGYSKCKKNTWLIIPKYK
ncbi:hypothetical protein A5823_002852 [Enterococcus faecalis]|uniref:hypothetical protein n=1 Tax=Enterococcus faecalis TaxID=1351 RepID=UPI000A333372|nr:hypothetical protein [Enterococcus faecalis]OTP25096.1 hypothetical protein A5823_002852 [Enterococcus faecalis]